MAKPCLFSGPKPPKVITVLGYTVKVKTMKKLTESGIDLYGRYCPEKREIHLLDHERWAETLLHEIIHMILDLTGAIEGLSETDEERLVVALTSGIYPLIKL